MSNLLSFMKSGKCYLTIIVDSSSSISEQDFKTATACVLGMIERTPKDSLIQIINFSTTADLVSEFSDNKELIIKNVNEKLKRIGGGTNLDAALKLSLQRINTKQQDYENIVVVITDGMPSDDPTSTIATMMSKGIKFYNVGIGSVTQQQMDKLFYGQNNMIFKKYDDLIEYIDQFSPEVESIPLYYKFYSTNNNIQKTSETLKLSCEIAPSLNDQVYKPNEIELSLIQNKYYFGFNAIVGKQIDVSNPYIIDIQLRVSPNCSIQDIPHSIEFNFKIKGRSYRGFITLDLSWFAGEFASNTLLNIFVDGLMGHGKSSTLNLLFNLFTAYNVIEHQFLATRNTNHTTIGIQFNPIFNILQLKEQCGEGLPIYKEIIEKVKIVLIDKAGMVGTDNNIDYALAAKGCYRPNNNKIDVDTPNQAYESHAFIFVLSMDIFSKKTEVDLIRSKIKDCIEKARIQPILAITFSDQYEHEEREEIKKDIYQLPVEKENIFFITPYIHNEVRRNPKKDMVAFSLMKRAFEISKSTTFTKLKLQSQSMLYGLSLGNNDNNNNNQHNVNYNNFYSSPNKTPSNNSSVYSTPTKQQPHKEAVDICYSPAMNLNTSSCTPDAASSNKTSKPIALNIKYSNKVTLFKAPRNITIGDLIKQVADKFSIENFHLEDQDGCELSRSITINDIVDEVSEYNVCFN